MVRITLRRLSRPAIVLAALSLQAGFPAGSRADDPCPTGGFVDRTAQAGLTWYQTSWGAALCDLDLDGDLDIYAGHHAFQPTLYWNDGTGTFDPGAHNQPWTGPADRHGILLLPLDGEDTEPDLFITHGAQGGASGESNELFRNDGNGVFLLIAGAAGMSDTDARSRCASAADFDGDHRVDVWVGKAPDGVIRNSLFRNEGPYTFTDVAAAVGLDESWGTVGGIWGDVDDDGDPDLLAGGEEFGRPTRLFRNDAGTFSNQSGSFSPSVPSISGADWGDYDGDGDLDLAACDGGIGIFDTYSEGDSVTYFFNTRYFDTGIDGLTVPSNADTTYASFRIRGELDFDSIFLGPSKANPPPVIPIALTDDYVGAPAYSPGVDRGVFVWRDSPGGQWFVICSTPNVNADAFDGWLTESVAIENVLPIGLEDPGFTPGTARVWRNDGGSFVETSSALGLPGMLVNPRDISWIDFDNDGDLDLHVVDMGTSETPNAPDALFRNDGSLFVDVASAQGVQGSSAGMGDGGTWGDVDNDGDLDLFLMEGAGPNAFSALGPALFLQNNNPTANGSLQIELVGQESGRAPIGTKVTAVVAGQTIVRRLSANSWRGFSDPLRVHIGLGPAAGADTVTVEWPFGTVDVYTSLPAGIYQMEEGGVGVAAPLVAGARSAWRLESVRPQPARGEQAIYLAAERDVRLAVAIHDVTGRLVRRLHEGTIAAGLRRLVWDGRDAAGRTVAGGVYFIRVTDGRSSVTRKSVRVR